MKIKFTAMLRCLSILVISYAFLLSTVIPISVRALPLTPVLSALTISPLTAVVGGANAIGKVTLSEPAPPTGAIVQLSDTVAAAEVPPSITVPPGLTTKAFTIKTSPVTAIQNGLVRATFGGVTKTATLTLRPIGVLSVKFANSTVIGGNNAVCTVTLERPAAPGNIRVAIASSNTGVAIPTVNSILFPAGVRALSLGIRTLTTTQTRSADIKATANGMDKSGKLTVIPGNTSCNISLSPTGKQFPAAGGSGSINVAVGANCSWTASKNVNWITITSGASGSGSGTVNYSVAANTGSASRTGALTIGAKTFTINQSATGCSVSISPASKQFTSAAGTGTINVTAGVGCSWAATKGSNADWISITSGASGSGNGVVGYSVAANTGTTSRTGTISIADKTHTITQEAAGGGAEVNETVSPALIALSGVSPTAFNPLTGTVKFLVTAATLSINPSDTTVYMNNGLVSDSNVLLTPTSIMLTAPLQEGRNKISLQTVDTNGLPARHEVTVWAGNRTLTATILDENGNPANGAIVTARLSDNLQVMAQATSVNGSVTFNNIMDRTILLEATANGNRYATIATTGNVGAVQYKLIGFDAPSTINNNDFSLGTQGWDTGSAPVTLVTHSESASTPPFSKPSNADDLRARVAEREAGLVSDVTGNETYATFNESEATADSEQLAPVADTDLMLSTDVEGPQSMSRTFQIKPGTKNVTVRYKFITSEVPGGYFGSKYNDYYNVVIRSKQSGTIKTDSQSMNGLGLSSFNAGGQTAWRTLTLPVNILGDTVELNFTVANVADGLYDSQLVVDLVDENSFKISKLDLRDKVSASRFDPLAYLSADEHSYFGTTIGGGVTRIYGTMALEGDSFDGVQSIVLEVLEGGGVRATANLSDAAKTLLLKDFGSAGKVEIPSPILLFELPSSQAANLNGTVDTTLKLRAKAQSKTGKTTEKYYSLNVQALDLQLDVVKLVRYKNQNRFPAPGIRDFDVCRGATTFICGGDDWVVPSVRTIVEHFGNGVNWNDFSNMNGGYFPKHVSHTGGLDVDGLYTGYEKLDFAAGQKMIQLLNLLPLSDLERIEMVLVKYDQGNPNDPFRKGIESIPLNGSRAAKKIIKQDNAHYDHFHIRFFPTLL